MRESEFPTQDATLPFSIDEQTWDLLSSDIRCVLWDGWSLKLQLNDLRRRIQYERPIEETRGTRLIKPVAPLTPEQSRKRQMKVDIKAARINDVKRASADRINVLRREIADED